MTVFKITDFVLILITNDAYLSAGFTSLKHNRLLGYTKCKLTTLSAPARFPLSYQSGKVRCSVQFTLSAIFLPTAVQGESIIIGMVPFPFYIGAKNHVISMPEKTIVRLYVNVTNTKSNDIAF